GLGGDAARAAGRLRLRTVHALVVRLGAHRARGVGQDARARARRLPARRGDQVGRAALDRARPRAHPRRPARRCARPAGRRAPPGGPAGRALTRRTRPAQLLAACAPAASALSVVASGRRTGVAGTPAVASRPTSRTPAAVSVVTRAAVTMASSAAVWTAGPAPGASASPGMAAPADCLTTETIRSWSAASTPGTSSRFEAVPAASVVTSTEPRSAMPRAEATWRTVLWNPEAWPLSATGTSTMMTLVS